MESAKKNPLYENHAAAGATFCRSGGLLLPKHYGDPGAEAKSAGESAGLADVSGRGKLLLSGPDHVKFLQGMLTNDIEKTPAGAGLYAAVLTPKGKMVSDMRVFRKRDSVYMDTEPGTAEDLRLLLERYRLSYRAEISDVTGDRCVAHVCGPASGELVGRRLGVDCGSMREYDHADAGEAVVMKVDRTGTGGFDVAFENRAAQRVWETLRGDPPEAAAVGLDAVEIMRIEAGIPVYGKDMDSSTIPIEAGIWSALDFEKGCYVGQEVIARTRWRGRVNWHLARFESEKDSELAPGDLLAAGERKVGRITSAVFSPGLGKNVALGYVRREFREYEGEMDVLDGKSSEKSGKTAKISKKPLHNPFK